MNDEGLDTRDLILALELPNASLITSYNDFNFSGNEIGAMGIFQAFHIVNFFDGFPEWRNLTFDFNMNGLTSEQSILDALFMRIEWGRVSHFYANYNTITGTIPSNISGKNTMESLDLSWNYISGSIPKEFERLASLQLLNLAGNVLTSSIPSTFANLTRLQLLNLSDNYNRGRHTRAIWANGSPF